MSNWLYLHPDLTGQENVWKVGKAILPHSAVRLRQRICWETVGIEHLWFGMKSSIEALEQSIKDRFHYKSRAYLKGFGSEMLQVPVEEILAYADLRISRGLHVVKVPLDSPYTATSSKHCPLRTPPESAWDWYSSSKSRELWHSDLQHPLTEDRLKKVFYNVRTGR